MRRVELAGGRLIVLEQALSPEHYLAAFTRSNIAELLLVTGRRKEALAEARRAHRDLCQSLPRTHRYVEWASVVLKRTLNKDH